MKQYICTICGFVYDGDQPFEKLKDDWVCPLCSAPKAVFEAKEVKEDKHEGETEVKNDMEYIQRLAESGETVIEAMGTRAPMPDWKDLLFLGAQLSRTPLYDHEEVDTTTIIGKNAKQPMRLAMPFYVSHMSFGALSKEAKIALAKGTAAVHTAMCSGEGGILPEEKTSSYRYIFEYIPNKYSVNDENLRSSDAIEIKIGQGTKPGLGGHLPKEKVTEEIAAIRGKPMGQDIHSPSHFEEIKSKEDVKALVEELRERSQGRPIGIKIAAGHLEEDLEIIAYAGADFVTIDGRGGATGASPKILRDSSSIPSMYALSRAAAFKKRRHLNFDIIITGGFRTSADIAKAIAMGAAAVALASASMIALGCRQLRMCHKGTCPLGIGTQAEELRKNFDVEEAAKRVERYFNATQQECKMFARILGHSHIHDLNLDDMVTTKEEIARSTGIAFIGTPQ